MTAEVKICPKCNTPIKPIEAEHMSKCECSGCKVAREEGLCADCGKVEDLFRKVSTDPDMPKPPAELDKRSIWLLTGITLFQEIYKDLNEQDEPVGALAAMLTCIKYSVLLNKHRDAL